MPLRIGQNGECNYWPFCFWPFKNRKHVGQLLFWPCLWTKLEGAFQQNEINIANLADQSSNYCLEFVFFIESTLLKYIDWTAQSHFVKNKVSCSNTHSTVIVRQYWYPSALLFSTHIIISTPHNELLNFTKWMYTFACFLSKISEETHLHALCKIWIYLLKQASIIPTIRKKNWQTMRIKRNRTKLANNSCAKNASQITSTKPYEGV